MPLLASRLDLGNLTDVEAVCSAIVRRQLSSGAGYLEPADREDAIAYLIGETWALWLRFDAERGATFRTYASPILQRRIVDWYRAKLGRSSNAPRPRMVSTSELENAELERALRDRAGDDFTDCDPDLRRVLAGRGGSRGGLD